MSTTKRKDKLAVLKLDPTSVYRNSDAVAEIIVQCRRLDQGTTHVRFELLPDGVSIWHGTINAMRYFQPDPVFGEFLPVSEYEEIALLHDGAAWNVEELAAWVRELEIIGGAE